jgi:protein phosphatase 2C family protein 2/3
LTCISAPFSPIRCRRSLSRTIGDASVKKQQPGIRDALVLSAPELTITQLDGDCLFLILATDGLWDVMSSDEAVEYVYRKLTVRRMSQHEVARKLVARALRLGSSDNVTALVVFFTQW